MTHVISQPSPTPGARRREALRRAYTIILAWPKSAPDREDVDADADDDNDTDGESGPAEEPRP